jgi:hypothetical protein
MQASMQPRSGVTDAPVLGAGPQQAGNVTVDRRCQNGGEGGGSGVGGVKVGNSVFSLRRIEVLISYVGLGCPRCGCFG